MHSYYRPSIPSSQYQESHHEESNKIHKNVLSQKEEEDEEEEKEVAGLYNTVQSPASQFHDDRGHMWVNWSNSQLWCNPAATLHGLIS